jgi:hypothetical protein
VSEITKQERIGLDELFTAIEKHRYHSKWKVVGHWLKTAHKEQKRFMMKSFKTFKH